MNAARMTWIGFVLFALGIVALCVVVPSQPDRGGGVVAAITAVTALSFVYAMYLCLAVIRYGDRRLVKRGVKGSAVVRSAHATSVSMAAGEYEGIGAPTVWKYGLDVTAPDQQPYSTNLYVCAYLQEGQTLPVFVSRLNPKRVAVDLKQLAQEAAAAPPDLRVPQRVAASAPVREPDVTDELGQLAALHDRGALSDAEFHAAKSRLLEPPSA